MKYSAIMLLLIISFNCAKSQVGIHLAFRDVLRNNQLTVKDSVNNSFTDFSIDFDSSVLFYKANYVGNKIKFAILPIGLTSQFNSNYPTTNNDGSLQPIAGIQYQLTAGFKIVTKNIHLQFYPELNINHSKSFDEFPSKYDNFIWGRYYKFLNQTDIPENFNSKDKNQFYLGQSEIGYSNKTIGFGISSKNIWWGPGRKNSLVMTYSAPGFLHYYFKSTKPINTRIGSFEWQVIGGQLKGSRIIPSDTNRVFNGRYLYAAKKDNDRYMTGLLATWQPKWIKDLFLGISSVSYMYSNDINSIFDVLPLDIFFESEMKQKNMKASMGSMFMRYVIPKENTEIYFEYGRSDKPVNPINAIFDKNHPKGFVFGLQKMFALKRKSEYLKLGMEFSQLQLNNAILLMDSLNRSWYADSYVRHGYTNVGQTVGASIGPGSNSQTFDIEWIKGFKKVGLSFERVVRNNDFYYYAFQPSLDYNRHWIELTTTLNVQWDFRKFYFSTGLGLSRSLNYQWYLINPSSSPDSYFKGGWDVLNFKGFINCYYRL